MNITYTLNVTVTRPVRSWDHDVTIEDAADWMVGKDAQDELTRETMKALRVLDGDCDVEVIETSQDRSDDNQAARDLADRGWCER